MRRLGRLDRLDGGAFGMKPETGSGDGPGEDVHELPAAFVSFFDMRLEFVQPRFQDGEIFAQLREVVFRQFISRKAKLV